MSESFKVIKITKLDEVKEGDTIPTSDFAQLTATGQFVQFKFHEEEKEVVKYKVSPGTYTIIKTMIGLRLEKTSFVRDKVLDDFINTKNITDKIDTFFNRLHVYQKHGIEVPKRSLLLFGPAGTGKTSAITQVVEKYGKDGKSLIVVWPTDKFEAHMVKDFVKSFEYVGVERMILVAEDIGGTEIDVGRMRSDSSLLSLLDNQEKTFTIPICIISTTNHPEVFLGNLTNRPGRFDDKIEVGFPKPDERVALLKFFTDNCASTDALDLMAGNKTDEFSIAHIKDVVLRADLYDKPIEDVIRDISTEIAHYNKAFTKTKTMGFGFNE